MNFAEFQASLAGVGPPAGLTYAMEALWWDAKGEWNRAHECAQRDPGRAGCAVHAYLHRKEGDALNARYWYDRVGQPVPDTTLEAEWERLARHFLEENPT